MNSLTTRRFWDCYHALPKEIQQRAQKAYTLFVENNEHPSLRLKKVSDNPKVYSVRITQAYRALGVKSDNTIYLVLDWIP